MPLYGMTPVKILTFNTCTQTILAMTIFWGGDACQYRTQCVTDKTLQQNDAHWYGEVLLRLLSKIGSCIGLHLASWFGRIVRQQSYFHGDGCQQAVQCLTDTYKYDGTFQCTNVKHDATIQYEWNIKNGFPSCSTYTHQPIIYVSLW